jgi:dipeptidyl aminopeptidase/acylaminoacyl peptidase
MMKLVVRWVVLLAVAATPAVAETHPFSVHDMLAMDRLFDAQLSPCGKVIVFGLRTTDLEANRGRTDLWLVGVDGEGLRRLTTHPAGDYNPRWSVDGSSIFFLSTRSDSSQAWQIPVNGGEARQVTDLALDVSSLGVSPDGERLLVSMDVFVDCDTVQCTRDRLDEIAERKATGRVYERLFIRHWDTWKDGRRSHIFAVPIEERRGMSAWRRPGRPISTSTTRRSTAPSPRNV